MSKRINVKSNYYNTVADVIIRGKSGVSIAEYADEWGETKNAREIKSRIVKSYADDGITVRAADIIIKSVTKFTTVHAYKVNASNDAIIAACIAAGLDVVECAESDPDTDENDTDSDK